MSERAAKIAEEITAAWWDCPAIETREECVEALTRLVDAAMDAGQPLRVAIVGSRPEREDTPMGRLYTKATLARHEAVRAFVRALPKGTVIVTGAWWRGGVLEPTDGVDRAAAEEGRDAGLTVCLVAGSPVHGKAAGVIRNPVVVDIAHGVKAFMDAPTPGTTRTMGLASKAGKLLA